MKIVMIHMTSRHKEKLQFSSTLKQGTEVESPNPGQPLSVQPQCETETNAIKGGNNTASIMSRQWSWPGNLRSQVCLPERNMGED